MILEDLKKLNLPDTPGVYYFKDPEGHILYIGKATSLRSRVRSYFSVDLWKTRGRGIVDMVAQAAKLTYTETQNVLEALIVEANEIKRHRPYYNVKEKDDKSFYCVVITREPFPRVVLVRQKDIDTDRKIILEGTARLGGVRYQAMYGPYPSGSAIKEALNILRRIFPFRDVAASHKDKETFYRQIGLAPDLTNAEGERIYKETIAKIKLFLSGKFSMLRKTLEKEMHAFAKAEEFEKASLRKWQLFSLDHVKDISLLKRDTIEEYSVYPAFRIESYDVAHQSGEHMQGVMTVLVQGIPEKESYRKFNIRSVTGPNDPAALRETLTRRLGHPEWRTPNLIVVDGNLVQKRAAESVLKEKGFAVDVVAVVKNERHRPRAILGKDWIIKNYKDAILLANAEAHRYSIAGFRKRQTNNFLPKNK